MRREIHVTFQPGDLGRLHEAFRLRPRDFLGVRVHRFWNLPRSRGASPKLDFMTGVDVDLSLDEATEAALRHVRLLQNYGVTTLRHKIECPASEYPESELGGYYETHVRVEGVPGLDYMPTDWRNLNLLVSRSMKSSDWHVTVRSVGCSMIVHRDRFSKASRILLKHGVQLVSPPRHEYVEYDSQTSYDWDNPEVPADAEA